MNVSEWTGELRYGAGAGVGSRDHGFGFVFVMVVGVTLTHSVKKVLVKKSSLRTLTSFM